MFFFREQVDLGPDPRRGARVEVAFTDASLDLGDAAPHAEQDRARLARAVGVPLALSRQVHGADVHEVLAPDGPVPTADAQTTGVAGIALTVRVADCVPVVLAGCGEQGPRIGVVHAGRAGVALGVVGRAVAGLAAHGIEPASMRAWVGPHVCGRCYEVPAAMREEVAAIVPAARATTRHGTPSLDLGAGVEQQLRDAGLTALTRVPGCTLEDDALHSYRRDGAAAGRFAALVWLS